MQANDGEGAAMRVVEYESEGYKSSNFTVSGPWISAVVTIYRRSELAEKALQSVLCQSYPWIEVIAIEDGSCSDIGHWLQQSVFCNKVWRYMRAEQNQGLAVTRNYALKRAKGAYIAFLDDDDSWAENKIEKQMQVMHKMPNIDAVVSGAIFFDRYGASERLYTISGPVRDMLAMHSTRVFPDNTALYRVDTLRTICGFDEQLRSHTEYGLWMRLAAINAIVYCLHDTLVSINQYHIDQMTTDYEIRMQVTDVAVMQWRVAMGVVVWGRQSRMDCERIR